MNTRHGKQGTQRIASIILVGVIGGILVIYAVLGINSLRAGAVKRDAAAQVARLPASTSQGTAQSKGLESQLAAAQTKLTAEQALFAGKLDPALATNWVLQLADETHIKVHSVQESPITSEKTENGTYKVLRLELTGEGSIDSIEAFMSRLKAGGLSTLVAEKMNAAIAPGLASASISLAVYGEFSPPEAQTASSTPGN